MAKAGFYALAEFDQACCFHCGVIVSDWALADDNGRDSPIVRHVLESPTCVYMIQTFGKRFVCDVLATFEFRASRYGLESGLFLKQLCVLDFNTFRF